MGTEETLKGHDLFQSLSVEEAHRLSDFSSVKSYQTGESVFECGKPGTHVFMLVKGSVNLRLPADQADVGIVVSKISRGELFGLSPLLDSPRYTTTAQCMEPSEVLVIEARPLRQLLEGNSLVAIQVLNRVARIYFSRYLDVLRSLQEVVNKIPLIR